MTALEHGLSAQDPKLQAALLYELEPVVEQNLERHIKLAKDWNWNFDASPLTFKQAGQARYYQYVSSTADTLTFNARSRYDTPNPPNPQPERHHFNLYVEIGQSGAVKNGFRIDPEVKNPPPND